MKPNEPLGNPLFAPFFVRLGLGTYFILAGFYKLEDINSFARQVIAFGVIPESLASVYSYLLPYVEISAGCLLTIGLWTTAASICTSLMLFSFVVALGLFPESKKLFNKDIILLGASLSLMYSGAGAVSVDRFRKMG